jgi:hypothetical protein
MADNDRLELVVEVDVNKADASIKSVNTGPFSMEQAAPEAGPTSSARLGVSASKHSCIERTRRSLWGGSYPDFVFDRLAQGETRSSQWSC